MKQLFVLGLLALPACGAYGNGYTYRRTVTIDKAKVPNTDQTNFPVLFSGTYSYLAHTTNGGLATDLNGYDIIFTSDAAGSTKLDHKIRNYNNATGALAMQVRVPTVATASDTVIYLFYGNASVTTSQQNTTGVWNSNYKGVWLMADGSTLSSADETGVNNGSGTATATTGPTNLNGAAAFSGSQSLDMGTNSSLLVTGNVLTIEAWVKRAASGSTGVIAARGSWSGGWLLVVDGGCGTNIFGMTKFSVANLCAGTMPADTNWHHVMAVWSATGQVVYIDGAASSPTASNTANFLNPVTGSFLIGNYHGGDAPFTGSIDEVRMSNIDRSADWAATSYNNQSSPGTFYSIGSQEVASARRRVWIIQ